MGKLDPLRHHRPHEDLHGAFGGDRFGQWCESVARFMGTSKYLTIQSLIVLAWVIMNSYFLLHAVHHKPFDPYPFILLNLVFSTQASYAAPMILLAQTRQAARDKAVEEASAKHRQEESDRLAVLLRQNTDLTREVHAQTSQIRHMQAELNLIRQAVAPGVPDPKVGGSGRPGADPGGDSLADHGEHDTCAECVCGIHGHDQPADAPGNSG